MRVRDAVEADAEQMATLTDSPLDVMRNLVHDRTVRVAIDPAGDEPANQSDEEVLGFVSFDARGQTVHVTQIAGSEGVCRRLLEAPIRFARREDMDIELLVPEADSAVRAAATSKEFTRIGAGPQFEGRATVRYRLDPNDER
ncbi:MAG: hypothetical protein ACOCR6_00455 [archaeon]